MPRNVAPFDPQPFGRDVDKIGAFAGARPFRICQIGAKCREIVVKHVPGRASGHTIGELGSIVEDRGVTAVTVLDRKWETILSYAIGEFHLKTVARGIVARIDFVTSVRGAVINYVFMPAKSQIGVAPVGVPLGDSDRIQ